MVTVNGIAMEFIWLNVVCYVVLCRKMEPKDRLIHFRLYEG